MANQASQLSFGCSKDFCKNSTSLAAIQSALMPKGLNTALNLGRLSFVAARENKICRRPRNLSLPPVSWRIELADSKAAQTSEETKTDEGSGKESNRGRGNISLRCCSPTS